MLRDIPPGVLILLATITIAACAVIVWKDSE